MQGQWIGDLKGTNSGLVVLDIDDLGSRWEGHAFAFDDDTNIPGTLVKISTTDKNTEQKIETDKIAFMDPFQPVILSREQIESRFPDVTLPKRIVVNIKKVNETLNIAWESDIGTNGEANLLPSAVDTASSYQPKLGIVNWADFRNLPSASLLENLYLEVKIVQTDSELHSIGQGGKIWLGIL